MARKGWLTSEVRAVIVCLALTFVAACGVVHDSPHQPASTSTPGATATPSNQYKAEGVVKALNPKGPAIEIDHGDVEGLMPAMQMEFPVTDANLLNGLAVNDRIDFTIENATDAMKVVAIKKK